MIKYITIFLLLISLNVISQIHIFQTIKVFKPNKDSCSIITQLTNKGEKVFRSEVRCKTIYSDSLSLIELRKTRLIQVNIPWINKK